MSATRVLLVAGALLVLGAVNYSIVGKERIKRNGEVIFLDLAPVDPRSLMQGDYMALNYRIANLAFGSARGAHPADGYLVVGADADGVAAFRRFDDGAPLAPDEVRLRYRWRDGPKFATNAFFFEEGTASRYARARYGEFRVSDDGDMILTGLRGEDRRPL